MILALFTFHQHCKTSLLEWTKKVVADREARLKLGQPSFRSDDLCSGDWFCVRRARQRSAYPTLFAIPEKLTAISSSNLPSFTWMSHI